MSATWILCLALGAAPTGPRTTLAVAPFTFSGDKAHAWLAEALPEAMSIRAHRQADMNALTERQVRAAMRQLGLHAQDVGKKKAAFRLGRQLGADLLVCGSLKIVGEAMQLRVLLFEPNTEAQRPEMALSGKTGDPIALEHALAKALARGMGRDPKRVRPGEFGTESSAAWMALSQALGLLAQQSLDPKAADANVPPALSPSDLERAETLLGEALQHDPNLVAASAARAVLHALRGELDPAAEMADATLKAGGQILPLAVLATAFVRMRQGCFDKAEALLAAVIGSSPGFLHARGSLAELRLHFGRFREARATLLAYSEAVPKQPWVLVKIGYTHAKQRHFDKAIAVTEQAVALLPDSTHLLVELASRYIDAQRHDEALTTLAKAAKIRPQDPRIHVRMGYLHLLRGKDAQAIKASKKGVELADPHRNRGDLAYAHLNLARAYGHKQRAKLFFKHLRSAKEAGLDDFSEVEGDAQLAKMRQDRRYSKLIE